MGWSRLRGHKMEKITEKTKNELANNVWDLLIHGKSNLESLPDINSEFKPVFVDIFKLGFCHGGSVAVQMCDNQIKKGGKISDLYMEL